jgi:hypothetical protein
MKKFVIPRLTNVLTHNERGRAAELIVNRAAIKDDYEMLDDAIVKRYNDYIKLNKLDMSAAFNFPKLQRRLNERRRPCEYRRQEAEDERRAIDRNTVNGFCNWFMWSRGAYKPPVSNKKKK